MAISNFKLNVTANTARALADFNKFSRSLDNKFLVSGLKLDVLRSSLNQISQDFQRAIGEQGLASATSLRSVQNQAALLTQTFKGFANESSLAITEKIGTALNKVALKAGGTMKDIQSTMMATPFISTRMAEEQRIALSKQILEFQKNFRRSGMGENFGEVITQFLRGEVTGLQMVGSNNPLEAFIGSKIIERVGGEGRVYDPLQRSQVVEDITSDQTTRKFLETAARRAQGFRIILEDMNTNLFNTETGVFGSLRKVVDASGKTTTMFDEVEVLVEEIYGKNGTFAVLFKAINEAFGIKDNMSPLIAGIQFTQQLFRDLRKYFEGSDFKNIVNFAGETFQSISKIFQDIYDAIRLNNLDPSSIAEQIGGVGESIRDYIKGVGENIRNTDTSAGSEFSGTILGSLVEEVGKTTVVLIKELFGVLVEKAPEIGAQVLPTLNNAINKVISEAFGEGFSGKVAKLLLGLLPGAPGAIARASFAGDLTGNGGSMLSMLAMGAGAFIGPGRLLGLTRAGGRGVMGASYAYRGVFGPQEARLNFLESVLRRTNRLDASVNSRLARSGFQNRMDLTRTVTRNMAARAYTGMWFGRRNGGIDDDDDDDNGGGRRRRRGGGRRPPGSGSGGSLGDLIDLSLGQYIPASSRAGGLPRRNPVTPSASLAQITDRNFRSFYSRRLGETWQRGGMQYGKIILGQGSKEPWTFVGEGLGVNGSGYEPWTVMQRPIYGNRRQRRRARREYIKTRELTSPGISQYAADLYNTSDIFSDEGQYLDLVERDVMDVDERYRRMRRAGRLRRPSFKARMRRFMRRPGLGRVGKFGAIAALGAAGASVFLGGGSAQAQGMGNSPPPQPPGPGVGDFLGGAFNGATAGATIGSFIPGIGTAAGAVIGGVIGGIAPFMSKEVKESISNTFSVWGKGLSETFAWLGNALKEAFKGVLNGMIKVLNAAITAGTLVPKMMVGLTEMLWNKIPESLRDNLGFISQGISAMKGVTSFQIPSVSFYEGLNYTGPAMALEARMSGRRPLVVNDGEFVIPKDGFPTLAGMVGQNLKTTGVVPTSGGGSVVQVNIDLQLNVNSVVANPEELASTLREPVYKIIGDAWREATNANRVQRNRSA
jgi:hypothetical protein